MKSRYLPVVTLLLSGFLLLAPAPALQAKEGGSAAGTMERIITMRNWKLMEKFDLSGQEAQRVFSILEKVDDRRARLIKKRRKILRQLREETKKSSVAENTLDGLIKEYLYVMEELSSIPARELEELKEVFDTRQQAEYLLFSQDIAREIRQLMRQGKLRNSRSGEPRREQPPVDFR